MSKILILQGSPKANGNTAWMAEEYKGGVRDVDNIEGGHQGNGTCIQRMYCVNKPANVKKMALLMSSYSPGVYDGATAEFRDICNYWQVENMGFVSAKIDEQKTEDTKQKVIALVNAL